MHYAYLYWSTSSKNPIRAHCEFVKLITTKEGLCNVMLINHMCISKIQMHSTLRKIYLNKSKNWVKLVSDDVDMLKFEPFK